MSRPRTRAGKGGPAGEKCVAIYMRIPGAGRPTVLQESDLQRWSDLRTWAHGQGREVVWYRDSGGEGREGRPEWDRLLADVEAGRVSTVVCWRLDRLGLTCSNLVRLLERLAALQVNLISVKDRLDLATPEGRRMANAFASVALYESELRAERIMKGQEAARSRGIRWGGSEKGRRVRVTPEREQAIRRLRAEGKGISHIARETGLSRPTVYKVLAGDGPDEDGRPPARGRPADRN